MTYVLISGTTKYPGGHSDLRHYYTPVDFLQIIHK